MSSVHSLNALWFLYDILDTTTIVHDIEEETTTEMVEEDTDIAEDITDDAAGAPSNSSLPLSPTVSPAPHLTPRTACPTCQCLCPTAAPRPPPVLQTSLQHHDSSRNIFIVKVFFKNL